MPAYRFYSIKHDGHIAGPAKDFEAARDDEATRIAKSLVNGHDIEVWEGQRLVAYVTSDEK